MTLHNLPARALIAEDEPLLAQALQAELVQELVQAYMPQYGA